MRGWTTIAVGLLMGLAGLAGCNGPYRPATYRRPEAQPFDYGVPVTDGPMLGNGGMYPMMPGTVMPPGTGMPPGTVVPPGMPPPNVPVMPPASGTPPLNQPPPTGPAPRSGPPPGT